MIKNKPFIEEIITNRTKNHDPPREIATRNKASPLEVWSDFKPFTEQLFLNIFNQNIDGVKIRFRYVTVNFNGRHKNK